MIDVAIHLRKNWEDSPVLIEMTMDRDIKKGEKIGIWIKSEKSTEELDQEIKSSGALMDELRNEKNYCLSDKIREYYKCLGIQIQKNKDGTWNWRKL